MIEAYIFATICVFSRGALNVFDRSYFKKKENSFSGGLFLNTFYTLCLALFFYLVFPCRINRLIELFFLPGIFFSALLAQLTAVMFSHAFKNMSVKSVIISSKLADIVIPMLMIPWTSRFNFSGYLFACISTCAFIPIFYSAKKESNYNYLSIFLVILCLSLQAIINTHYQIPSYSKSWIDFLEVFLLILFWRTLFCSIGILMPLIPKCFQKKPHSQSDEAPVKAPLEYKHKALIARSFIAFIAQGTFFYSITRHHDHLVWSILNTSPLIACFLAAKILKEKFERPEIITTISLLSIFIIYFLST